MKEEKFEDQQYYQYPPFGFAPSPFSHGALGQQDQDTIVFSTVGKGPKGDKGDPAYFDNLTDEQLEEIYKHAAFASNKSEDAYYTTTGNNTQIIPIPISSGFIDAFDILFVDVEGLDLVEDTDYTIQGRNIVLTEPITHPGTKVHFRALSYMLPDGQKIYINESDCKCYDNVFQMKGDSELESGDICHTLGFHEPGDGGAAWYIIKTHGLPDEDKVIAVGDMVAVRVYYDCGSIDLKNPSIEFVANDQKDSFFFKILKLPKNKIDTINIYPYKSTSADVHSVYEYDTTEDFIKATNDDFYFNGPLGPMLVDHNHVVPAWNGASTNYRYFVCINEDLSVDVKEDLNVELTAQNIVNMGYSWGWRAFTPIISNGLKYPWETKIPDMHDLWETPSARTAFGWDNDNFYFIFTEGQIPKSIGASFDDLYNLCVEYDITNLVNLDGGGSTQCWLTNPIENIIIQNKETDAYLINDARAITLVSVVFKGE